MSNKINQNNNIISNDNGINKNNKLVDNSINKNKQILNTKNIQKGKNKEKRNRNILPPQEKPSVENGKFVNVFEENFPSMMYQPEISDISFIRPNLEKLFTENREICMFAYVDAHRRKDNRYVLYNLCSETMFLSDHVIVNSDINDELKNRIGQCIKFKGIVRKYYDKYTVDVFDVEDDGCVSPRILDYKDIILNEDSLDELFMKMDKSDVSKQYEILKSLCVDIEVKSAQIFGSKKFIIGMLFDFFFMRTRNENISSNKYLNDMDKYKLIFIMILSDLIFRIDTQLITDFISLRERVLKICIVCQKINGKDVSENIYFNSFCIKMGINRENGIKYVKDIYKRYKLKDIIEDINVVTLNRELRYSTACVLSNM